MWKIAIYKLITEQEIYKTAILKFREHYVFSFGSSSDIGAQYIITVARGKQNAQN